MKPRPLICSYTIANLEAILALTDTGINAQEVVTSEGDTKLTCHAAEMCVSVYKTGTCVNTSLFSCKNIKEVVAYFGVNPQKLSDHC